MIGDSSLAFLLAALAVLAGVGGCVGRSPLAWKRRLALAGPAIGLALGLVLLVVITQAAEPVRALTRGTGGAFLLAGGCILALGLSAFQALRGLSPPEARLGRAAVLGTLVLALAGLAGVGWRHGALDLGDSYVFLAHSGKDWVAARPLERRGSMIAQKVFPEAWDDTMLVHDCAAGTAWVENDGKIVMRLHSTVASLDHVHVCARAGLAR